MHFDAMVLGTRASRDHTVTMDDIERFAAVTGDTNPVHLDEAAAARTRFGGRIAHGMLGAGFISAVLGTQLPGPGVVYMSQSLRFTKPVYPGDTITTTVEVTEVFAAKRRLRLTTTCHNQRGELVLDGEALVWVPEESA